MARPQLYQTPEERRQANALYQQRYRQRLLSNQKKPRRPRHEHAGGVTPLLDLPAGPFDLIYADPPWQYDYAIKKVSQNIEGRHYDCLPLESIMAMSVERITARNAVLLLWVTSTHLEKAFGVARAWGFEPKQQMIWHKLTSLGNLNGGMGSWTMCNHEVLLIAARGDLVCPDEEKGRGKRPRSVFTEPRGKHSQKPEIVYDIIDQAFPHLPRRVELFARTIRPGWTAWGNQVEETAAA